MDIIKVGDKLQKNDSMITIVEIYLFSPNKNGDFRPVIMYDWENIKTGDTERGNRTFDLYWNDWKKVEVYT